MHVPRNASGIYTPQSLRWLARWISKDKPGDQENRIGVIDTRKCCGPFLASVDQPAMVLFDTQGQGRRTSHGFANQKIVQAVYEGRFDHCLWNNPLLKYDDCEALQKLESMLLNSAPAGLEHICWVMGGLASAHDKALRMARMQIKESIRGRTRVLIVHPRHHRPPSSIGSQLNLPGFQPILCDTDIRKINSLLQRHAPELYAVVLRSDCLNPHNADENRAEENREFFAQLRIATLNHGLPLLLSEQMSTFAGRGTIFSGLHSHLSSGAGCDPDFLITGEVDGLAMVFSRLPDPEPESINVLAVTCAQIDWQASTNTGIFFASIRSGLQSLQSKYSTLIRSVDAELTSFRLEFIDASTCDRFVKLSLDNGLLLQRDDHCHIRSTFNQSFEGKFLKDYFARLEKTIADVLAHPDKIPSPVRRYSSARRNFKLTIQSIDESHWPEIMTIEKNVYEPERVDTEKTLRNAVAKGLGLAAIDQLTGDVLGFCIGGKIEDFIHLDGPKQDDRQGQHDSFYSADLAVSVQARGLGVGRMLKEQQIERARESGFKFVTGRNRIGATEEMSGLNRSLGAYPIMRLSRQYGGEAQADYYRIPLQPPTITPRSIQLIDWASGLQSPFGPQPSIMTTREWMGPLTTHLNLSRSTTPDIIHYYEHLLRILPRGTSHVYFSGSRDQTLEQCLQCLHAKRKAATIAIGMQGGYLGHISTAARSLSDPNDFSDAFGLFEWPRVSHPQQGSLSTTIQELSDIIANEGRDSILALVCEICGERSGHWIDENSAKAIHTICRKNGIPLVWVETASGGYRNGSGQCWASSNFSDEIAADAVLWYPGGQLGHVFISKQFAANQFELDQSHSANLGCSAEEVSAIRCHEHLRAAWKLDFCPAVEALDTMFSHLSECISGISADAIFGGMGLYRSMSLRTRQLNRRLHFACRERGLLLESGYQDCLLFVPPLDCRAVQILEDVAPILKQACLHVLLDSKTLPH